MSANSDWSTFGHTMVKNILDLQIKLGKLPHAYLFSGPEGLGKKMLALEFAKKILKTENLHNHPDFHTLEMGGEITVEPTLEFMAKVSLKPFLGEKKVAIINNAENLNLQAANALLKTLEEPGPSSVIILIGAAQKILPTIVSRCQSLNFSLFSKQSLKEFSQTQNFQADETELQLSFGRPGRLVELLKDPNFLAAEKSAVEDLKKIQNQTLGYRLAGLAYLAEMGQSDLSRILLTWFLWQSARLGSEPAKFTSVQAISNAVSGLKQNLNKKLVLQSLLMKI